MGLESQTSQPGCVARTIAAWLKARYPIHTIKQVARELCCTPKAAENLLNGHLSAAAAARLLAAYGPQPFIEASLAAAGTSLDSYIRGEAERAGQEQRRWEAEAERFADLQAHLLTRNPPDRSERPGVGRREA